jgi:hemerythrin-like domain-containing protein
MLRDKNLVPLSHQHQHALGLCVRIERAMRSGDTGLSAWHGEIQAAFETEIDIHFEAEEQFLFPSAARLEELRLLVSRLLAEHTVLRSYRFAAMAHSMGRSDMLDFAHTLSEHIRVEEKQLFESCQRLIAGEELAAIGERMREFFRASGLPGSVEVSASDADPTA